MTRATDTPLVTRPIRGVMLAFVLAIVALVVPTGATDVVGATADDELVVESGELAGSASSYLPVNPVRILDTRSDTGIKRVFGNSSFSIDPVTDTGVATAAGVDPDDITAVVVNTTMVRAAGVGFGTVWPTGGKRLSTSTNNTEFSGHTIPNLVIAPLGLDNKISVYASIDADLIIDVLGVFVSTPGATAAGRFEFVGPTRAYDSRQGDAEIARNGTVTIDLKAAGVPADATGVVLNVTAVRSKGRGFYRVWSAGSPPPKHSSVNVLGVDYTASNQVITGVNNGRIQVYSDAGGGLAIDITGYFTGPSAASSTDGLFVPFTPGRLLNTREVSGPTAGTAGQKVPANNKFALQVAGRLDVPATGVKAVALNVTAVRAADRGFIKVYPGASAEPETSALNFNVAGQIVANHAITAINLTNGDITLQPSRQTHILVDANGYFLAAGGALPTGGAAVTKILSPGTFAPDALPGASPTAGPYDFLFDRGAFFNTGIRPNPTIKAAWDNCSTIRYGLNVDLAENDQQIAVLISAVEEMEAGTGIDFQFGGVTSAGMNIDDPLILPESTNAPFMYLPPDDNGRGPVDLVIGFSNAVDTPDLRGGVIGIGGSLRTNGNAAGRAEQVRGFAVIDLPDLYVDGPAGPATLRDIKATTTHELGHMMGLGHVDASANGGGLNTTFDDALTPEQREDVIEDQLMFPSLPTNPNNEPNFNDGDLQGLFELYANRPCPGSGALGGEDERDAGIDWNDVTILKSEDDF